ncbi:MAG: peptidase M23 [Denitrovibrio sp.]|nr:MAG: peptidase M23 [Denitrovibrio sp.]
MKPQFKVFFILILIFCFTSVSYANVSTYRVKWGETLYSLLSDMFSPKEILSINKELKRLIPDFTLKKGTLVHASSSSITLKPNFLTDISINKVDDDFELDVINYPISTVTAVVEGTIESSLVQSVSDVGENIELAFMLAGIYEWEIDFFHALRKGDTFRILVEKEFARGKFIGYGKILAADFVNQGRLIRSLYYETEITKGYFKPDGTSMKKGFMKAPLRYSRISSGYTSRRLHPVTGKRQPHYAVDYAAPTGTPVYSTADGRVTARGYKKYNGNYIKIKHMNGYETMYLHLSKFKRSVKRGSYVRQGDLIGYVGSTGRSTGPHLDYRILKNGSYLNPLSFKAPEKKLPESEIPAFKDAVAAYKDKMDDTYAAKNIKFTLIR